MPALPPWRQRGGAPRCEAPGRLPDRARYWSGARGEPSQAVVGAVHSVLAAAVRECGGVLMARTGEDIEIALMPWGSVAWATLPEASYDGGPSCLADAVRRRVTPAPRFSAAYPVVLRFAVLEFIDARIHLLPAPYSTVRASH